MEIVEWLCRRGREKRDNGKQVDEGSGSDQEEDGEGTRMTNGEERSVRIIIAGHSVGAFIAMEVLRILGERRKKRGVGRYGGVEIRGGLMLFPTVMEIAKSPSGKILSVRTPPPP